MCGIKLLVHSQTSTVQPLIFGNGQVIYPILYWACGYVSMLALKLNYVSKWAPGWKIELPFNPSGELSIFFTNMECWNPRHHKRNLQNVYFCHTASHFQSAIDLMHPNCVHFHAIAACIACHFIITLYVDMASLTHWGKQIGRHLPDDIFKCIFLNENVKISIEVSLTFVSITGADNGLAPARWQAII